MGERATKKPPFLRGPKLNPNISIYSATYYHIGIAAIVLLALDVLVVESALAVYSALHLSSNSETVNSSVDPHINMITLLISIICALLSAYMMANSMVNVASWPFAAVRNITSLYGIGLRELIVSGYALLTSLYGIFTTIRHLKSLRIGAIVIQMCV